MLLGHKTGEIIAFDTDQKTADVTDLIPIKWRSLQSSASEQLIKKLAIYSLKEGQTKLPATKGIFFDRPRRAETVVNIVKIVKERILMTNNINFSRAETCLLMEPMHGNPCGNVHGGELMKIMDNTAAIAAAKHAKGTVVTARVDEIMFHKAIHIGDIVTCIAQLSYVGKTSMQVIVSVVVHELENYSQPETALTAFFTMVHLVYNKPAKVPELIVTTKEEEELYKLGEKKYREIKSKYKA